MRCSCGCEREVPFRDRGSNMRAATARKLVAEMEELEFVSDDDEYRRAFLFEGESWRNQYTRVVHGELTRTQTRDDDAWKIWLAGARPAVKEARKERG